MKRMIYPCFCAALLLSCNHATQSEKEQRTERIMNAAAELSNVTTDSMCYLLTEGIAKNDTTIIQLAIKGKTVSGHMAYLPYEKDSRRGILWGTKTGKKIQVQWAYMQEGISDTLALNFRLEDDALKQQKPAYDKNTGKEYFPGNAAYDRHYKRIDCNMATAVVNRY